MSEGNKGKFEKFEDVDRDLFDWCVDAGHKFIDRGYASAWFSWLGWVALTSALKIMAQAANSFLLNLVFIFSIVMLFFVGLAGVEKLIYSVVKDSGRISWLKLVLAVGFSCLGLAIVFEVLRAVPSFSGP